MGVVTLRSSCSHWSCMVVSMSACKVGTGAGMGVGIGIGLGESEQGPRMSVWQ